MNGTQPSYALAGLGEWFGGFVPSALHWAFEYLHRRFAIKNSRLDSHAHAFNHDANPCARNPRSGKPEEMHSGSLRDDGVNNR